jgi:hypothetical protein
VLRFYVTVLGGKGKQIKAATDTAARRPTQEQQFVMPISAKLKTFPHRPLGSQEFLRAFTQIVHTIEGRFPAETFKKAEHHVLHCIYASFRSLCLLGHGTTWLV